MALVLRKRGMCRRSALPVGLEEETAGHAGTVAPRAEIASTLGAAEDGDGAAAGRPRAVDAHGKRYCGEQQRSEGIVCTESQYVAYSPERKDRMTVCGKRWVSGIPGYRLVAVEGNLHEGEICRRGDFLKGNGLAWVLWYVVIKGY